MPITTVLGGAGTLDDIKFNIKFNIIGAAAVGSLFVFKGKYKAVLINYPNRKKEKPLMQQQFRMKQIIQDLKNGDGTI